MGDGASAGPTQLRTCGRGGCSGLATVLLLPQAGHHAPRAPSVAAPCTPKIGLSARWHHGRSLTRAASPGDQHGTVATAPASSVATLPGSLLRGQTGSRPRGAHHGWLRPLTAWLFLPEAAPRTPEGPVGAGVLRGAGLAPGGALGAGWSPLCRTHCGVTAGAKTESETPGQGGPGALQEAGTQRGPRLLQHQAAEAWASGRGLGGARLSGGLVGKWGAGLGTLSSSGCCVGVQEWGWPGHFRGSERRSASAGPSAHARQARPREPCRTGDGYEGSTWGELGDVGLTLCLPRPPGARLSPAGGSAAPGHPSLTCTRVSSPRPEAATQLDPSSTVPPAPFREIFEEDTHCPITT